MKNIVIEDLKKRTESDVEIIERKGIGHPDTICDGAAEAVSRALSTYYQKKFNEILHHNTDKGLLIAGQAKPNFGGGRLLKPIKLIVAGQATSEVENELIPVDEIALKAVKEYLKKNLHDADAEKDFVIETEIGGGSLELSKLGSKQMPLANDTSFGCGYAPLSDTEKLVLRTAQLLNTCSIQAVGSDVKVMGTRNKNKIDITVASAIIDKYVANFEEYMAIKQKIQDELAKLRSEFNTDREINFHVNTADDIEKHIVYITTTGLSAEMGDDGQVGRGNRVNGLIPVKRPISLEASAGKNPVNHIGKLYNVLANIIANDIFEQTEAEEVHVHLLSQIGKPINEPHIANILLNAKNNVQKQAEEIAAKNIDNIRQLTEKLVKGEISVF
ncbi:methionine adenosyltransferase [Candidatus Woesearchaeota archaeon]|nr:methionine adenosyltransferase [Candidatus Woesearchaeota archaeon]